MYLHPHQAHPQWVGIISRFKLSGVGRHVGVLLPDGRVAHLTPDGVEIINLDEFAQGRLVTYDKQAPAEHHWQILWRAYQSIGRTSNYNLLNFNCEAYARVVMGEKPESPQMQGVFVIGALVAFLALAK